MPSKVAEAELRINSSDGTAWPAPTVRPVSNTSDASFVVGPFGDVVKSEGTIRVDRSILNCGDQAVHGHALPRFQRRFPIPDIEIRLALNPNTAANVDSWPSRIFMDSTFASETTSDFFLHKIVSGSVSMSRRATST
jgi:hypothetical protein